MAGRCRWTGGACSSMVEPAAHNGLVGHLFWEQRVAGSNPVSPTIYPHWPNRGLSTVFRLLLLHHIDRPIERVEIMLIPVGEKAVRFAHMYPAVEKLEEPVLIVANDEAGDTRG